MAYTKEQYIAAGKKAVAAGDISAANEIAAEMDTLFGAPAEEKPYQLTEEDKAIFGSQTSSPTLGDGALNSLAIGADKGVQNVVDGATDLWRRATGTAGGSEEADRLRAEKEANDARFDAGFDGNWWAKGGELAGELVATAPVGGAIGKAAAGTGMAARTALLAGTEGAVSSGLTQQGGVGERAAAASLGFAAGAVGDKVLGFGARRIGARLPAQRSAGELSGDALDRINQAATNGGYRLNTARASQLDPALDRLTTVTKEDAGTAAALQGAQSDMARRARALLGEAGGDSASRVDDLDTVTNLTNETATKVMGSLSRMRTDDKAAATALYKELEALPGGHDPLPLDGLNDDVSRIVREGLTTKGEATAGAYLNKVLTKFGLKVDDEVLAAAVKSGDQEAIAAAKATRLTAANLGGLRAELNEIWDDSMPYSVKDTIRSLKTTVDDHIGRMEGALTGDESAIIAASKRATDGWNKYTSKWEAEDLMQAVTEPGKGGDLFKKAPAASLKLFLAKGKSGDLARVRERLLMSGNPADKEALELMQAVPLLSAINRGLSAGKTDAATRGVDGMESLSSNAFSTKLSADYDDKLLLELWGKPLYDKVMAASRAWDFNEITSTGRKQAMKLNPSGTSVAVHNASSFFIRTFAAVRAGAMALAALPVVSQAIKGVQQYNIGKDAAAMAAGQLPRSVQNEMRKEAVKRFGVELTGKYDKAIPILMRAAVTDAIYGSAQGDSIVEAVAGGDN